MLSHRWIARYTNATLALVALSMLGSETLAAQPTAAQVPPLVRDTEEYTIYAKFLVQIDLLANPDTAYLPIQINTLKPGELTLEGRVPTARLRQFLIDNAHRISGLRIEPVIEIDNVKADALTDIATGDLEAEVRATIAAFYPHLNNSVRVTVAPQGGVELHGDVPSYETKNNLSRLIKTLPGCRAVVNLLRVPANPATGLVQISEDGVLNLDANQLPLIPAAPLVKLSQGGDAPKSVRSMSMPLGDDAPASMPRDRQLVEDARAIIAREPLLAELRLDLEADTGGVVVSANIDDRRTIDQILEVLGDIPGITKVLVKSRPVSVQRCFPPQVVNDADTTEEESSPSMLKRMTSWMPFGEDDDGNSKTYSWRFRESVRKHLKQQCHGRVDDLAVKSTTDGLVIEGRVRGALDRAYVLRQIENAPNLRTVRCDVVLNIGDED